MFSVGQSPAAPTTTVSEKLQKEIPWNSLWQKPFQTQGQLKRSAVCLGVSGVNHPNDQERILHWLRLNDDVAALASGTMGKLHGCVLMAGTGSISNGFTEDGREACAAGGGPVLGDWGRGTYADPSWACIAALVPEVVSCAEAGDEIAHNILTVNAVVRSFPWEGKVGGVLEANKRWDIGKQVINCILKTYPGASPVRLKVDPAVGAALLAWNCLMKETDGNSTCLPVLLEFEPPMSHNCHIILKKLLVKGGSVRTDE